MIDEDLHNVERMLDKAPPKARVELRIGDGPAVLCHAHELGLVFSEAALFRKLRPTMTPQQVALSLTPDAPPPKRGG